MSRTTKKKNSDHAKKPQAAPPPPEPVPEPASPPVEEGSETREAAESERYLRLRADFENFRKRVARERADLFMLANEGLMQDLLPVLDHFEMGLSTAEKEKAPDSVLKGLRLVYDQFLAALEKYGLQPFDSEGVEFDPHQHEAVSHIPSDACAADRILSQIRRGYRLGNRLLRPAQVVVSSGSPGREVPPGEDGKIEV